MTIGDAVRLVEEVERILSDSYGGERAPETMREIREKLNRIRYGIGTEGGVGFKAAEVEEACDVYVSKRAILRFQDPAAARQHALNACGGLRMILGRLRPDR